MSCMTISFLKLEITRSDIRPHIKWVASLVIAYGHFNFPQVFVWVIYGITYSLYHPGGEEGIMMCNCKGGCKRGSIMTCKLKVDA